MHNEIKQLIEELKKYSLVDRISRFIEVEDITQSQVIIDGIAQNCPCVLDWQE